MRSHNLRLLGLSQVYPFNRWNSRIEAELCALISEAVEAGAETISLIPCNDGTRTGEAERKADLRFALERCLPVLEDAKMVALVEPLGFLRASIRLKSETIDAIEDVQGGGFFKLVHDTFHHCLTDERSLYPVQTGIVHISGVSDVNVPLDQLEDKHRVAVDAADRLGNLSQIAALHEAGYAGVFSFECFAPEVPSHSDPASVIKDSIDFISSQTEQLAA